ncbi:hypothetical protein MKY59_03285 [Paenibacillus sp. FSL W8-0426]|uniref:hypothetical protein n=1 Tax=Paenibacillus sp. FSL W8-0426 TaxID=2921714 RepID=UPI0030D8BE84
MLNEKITVWVREHVPGYEGKILGVARQGDIFIFRNPIGHLSDAEYLTCYKLGRSDFKSRSSALQSVSGLNKKEYLNGLSDRFMPILEAFWWEEGADVELYWSVMEKQGREPLQ